MTPSKEVDDAVGEAPQQVNSVDVAQLLNEKREAMVAARARYKIAREMRDEDEMATEAQRIDALTQIIRELEAADATTREATAKAAAISRLVGVKRAFGSVQSNLDADEQRVSEKIAELSDAISRLNDRYTQAVQLRAEAAALSDRFCLPKPRLPDVVAPARRDIAITLTRLPNKLLTTADPFQPTEQCEHNMRTRRTYAEAIDTHGYKIIESAGLKVFPELTTRQQEIITARMREKEQERRQMAGLPKIRAIGRVPLGSL
jgi:hypothetical protein